MLALLLFLNVAARADDLWISRRFTTSEGLAYQTVRDIVETPDGSIWLATWGGGVSRITGTEWFTYNAVDGLVGDAVRALLPDGDGGMWAGTSVGIGYFDGSVWTSLTTANTPGIEDNSIFCITRLTDGTIWFGTGSGSIQLFKPTPATPGEPAGPVGSWSVIDFPTDREKAVASVRAILQAQDGSVWVARDRNGLAHFQDGEWRFYQEEQGLLGGLRSLLQTRDGLIWAVGTRFAYRFEQGKWVQASQDDMRATSIAQREDGDLLLGSSLGMKRFHDGTWTDLESNAEIPRPKVETITCTKDGSTWIGASEGAFRLSKSTWSLFSQTVDEIDLRPTTFYVDADMAPLVLDRAHRLCRFEEGGWRAVSSSLRRNTTLPKAIVPGSNRNVWIAYPNSICKYALERDRIELELTVPTTARPFGLHRSPSGRVWVLCEGRVLEVVDDALVETRLLPVRGESPHLYCMEEGPDGSLWFGLSGGVQRLVDGAVEHFGTEVAAFENRHVQDICHGPDGRVWFNAPGSGLLCYDGTSWRNYRRVQDRLIGDHASSAYRALDGTLWFGFGTAGIMALRDGQWTEFSDREILLEGSVTAIGESPAGTYWLATYPEGLLRYRPTQDAPNTQITAFPNEIAPNGVGVIEFAGMDAWYETLPEDLLFSYRILNLSNDRQDDMPWSGYIDRTTVITPHLHSGSYSFEVRSIDRDRNIDATPAAVDFRVLAPFWQTPGFLISIGLLSLVAILSLALGISKQRNLRTSEEKYRLLVDHQTDMIIKMDVEGRLIYVSPSCCKVIGKTQRELLGRSFVPFIHEDDRERVVEAMERIHEPPYSVYVEERALTKDGWRWQGWQNTAVLDAQSKVVEIVAVGRDLTERKRAEEALRENERIYRGAIEASGTVPYYFDYSNMKYHLVGAGIEELTGYAPGEFDNSVWTSIVEREILTGDLRNLSSDEAGRKVREEVGVVWSADYRIRHRNGKARWLSNYAVQVLSDDGEIVGSLGLLQDITDRMDAEKALRESEELHRSAIEAAGAVPYYKNHVTERYEHVRPAIQSLVGLSNEEFTPEALQTLLQEVVLLGDLADLSYPDAVQRTKGPVDVAWRADNRIQTPNGESKWIGDAAVHVRDREGTVIGSLGILLDVTERHLAEENRRKLEEQLRQAQKMEAVGQLAGGIAHDFNNLLQAILGYTDMAKTAHGPEDQAYEDMVEVEKAADRAATLTTQLLAFSRRQLLQPVDLDLNDVIADLSKMLRRVIGENIELNLALGADLETINADPGALEQVLLNLCLNARDAMPKSGQLTIDTQDVAIDERFARQYPWAKVGKYALLSVTDTGVGITTEMLEHVFEPFFTTKDVGQGTGLGLSMVYGIVKQHDGLIHAYSEFGQGTTFKIYLPSGERGETNVVHADDIPAPETGTETILVAEDETMVRNVAVRVLEANGYTVLVAKDGEEAVRVFEANAAAIDLALLDVVMPKMSGREAHDRFLRVKPDICTLFTTGYSTSSIHSRFIIEDGLQVLPKPYASDALLRRVREVLSAR